MRRNTWLVTLGWLILGVYSGNCFAGSGIDVLEQAQMARLLHFQLAPDGKTLVISGVQDSASGLGIKRIPLDGGPSTVLYEDSPAGLHYFDISPDGNYIMFGVRAYTSGLSNSSADLYSVPMTGGPAVQISHGPVDFMSESLITRDSQNVLYLKTNPDFTKELHKVPIEGGPVTFIAEPYWPVNWYVNTGVNDLLPSKPFGEHIIVRSNGGIFVVPVDGGPMIEIPFDDPSLVQLNALAFTPAGDRLIYQYGIQTSSGNVRSLDLDGNSDPVPLFNGEPVYPTIQVSPDGGQVLYAISGGYGLPYHFYTQPSDASHGPVEVDASLAHDLGPYWAGYTPDGAKLYFTTLNNSQLAQEFVVQPATGGPVVSLTPDQQIGERLVFETITPDSRYALLRVHLEPGDVERKAPIYSVPLDGGPMNLLTPFVDQSGSQRASLAKFTPDSRFALVTAVNAYLEGSVTYLRSQELYIVPIEGGELVRLSAAIGAQDWIDTQTMTITPDGQKVLYRIDRKDGNDDLILTGIPLVAVDPGLQVTGEVAGGVGFGGGVRFTFDNVLTGGTLKADFSRTTEDDLPAALGDPASFLLGPDYVQWWDMGFDGVFSGPVTLTFTYDDNDDWAPGIEEALLGIYHQIHDGSFELLSVLSRDLGNNTIAVQADGLSNFVLGVVPEPTSVVALMALIAIYIPRRS